MNYTLDTSALLAYLLDEPGSDDVADILLQADKGKAEVFVSFMTSMELLYRVWRLSGERQAKRAYLTLRSLPVNEVGESEGILFEAAKLKAQHPISVADAWIAGTALVTGTILLHKDPELEPLDGVIVTKALPYK
ncbi:MAG: PIN domain-containing protein [Thermodesulfobacteriota bacterium]